MLCIGAVTCSTVLAPVLNLLNRAYGIGVPDALHPHPLLAPQASMMAAVAKGLFGGSLPWTIIWIGAALGLLIISLDESLRARGSTFRTPVLAVAVGIYLPIDLSVPIFIGGLLAHFAGRAHARSASEGLGGHGMLFAAGMIAGESLTGVILAIPIVASGRADILALPAAVRLAPSAASLLGLVLFAALAALLFRVARGAARSG
jgi:putative OPT family oligopeptide transporter